MKRLKRVVAVIISFAIIFSPLNTLVTAASPDVPPNILWEKSFNFINGDTWSNDLYATDDGGYLVAGYTTSTSGAGGEDVYLLKVDGNGEMQWEETFGGSGNERAEAVIETSDGGYILAGYTNSSGAGGYDAYIIKTGEISWEKTFGGPGNDYAYAVKETPDGNFIVVGYTETGINGGSDVALLKIDAYGDLVWQKLYGGSNDDFAYDLVIARDGSYIIVGSTKSYGAGEEDVFLLKVDISGEIIWQRTFGGAGEDRGYSVHQDTDGGYIIAGSTESFAAENQDIYLVKTDASGHLEWQRNFGGSNDDWGRCVKQTSDGGYAILGSTSAGPGSDDIYMLKTDVYGQVKWEKTISGSSGLSLLQADDEGYILAGSTVLNNVNSSYLVKLGGDLVPLPSPKSWEKTFGEEGRWDSGRDILQTADGGFLILAGTEVEEQNGNYDDIWLIKTDHFGDIQWELTLGGSDTWDYGNSLQETLDGHYIILGSIIDDNDVAGIYLVKVSDSGLVVWERTFYSPINYESLYGYSVIPTSDGGYLIVGEKCDDWPSYVYILKTDEDGIMEWDNTSVSSDMLQIDTENYRYSYGIAGSESPEGGFVIVTSHNTGFLSSTLFLRKLDSLGELEWSSPLLSGFLVRGICVNQANDGGYLASNGSFLIKTDSSGHIEWDYSNYGEELFEGEILEADLFLSVIPTKDAAYATTGLSLEIDLEVFNDEGYELNELKDLTDISYTNLIVANIDSYGNLEWQRSRAYGNNIVNIGASIQETTDGGFIAVGGTGNNFNHTDVYLVRLDPSEFYDEDINHPPSKEWPKTFGPGIGWSVFLDGEDYVIAGEKLDQDDIKAMLLKVGPDGLTEWQNTFGTSYSEFPSFSAAVTSDGGYIILTATDNYEPYLIKTDQGGNLQWEQTLGQPNTEYYAYHIQQTSDNGYILVGYKYNNLTYESSTFLIKTDALGQLTWEKTLTRQDGELYGLSVFQDSEGYKIIGEYWYSDNYDWENGMFILKTDQSGNELWVQYHAFEDTSTFLGQPTSDGGSIIVSTSYYYDYNLDTDIEEINLIKADALGNLQWHQTFGGDQYNVGLEAKQTTDGGYVIVGATTSFGNGSYDIYLVKTDSLGNLEWEDYLRSPLDEYGGSIQEISDGYIISGARNWPSNPVILLTKYKPN